MVDHASELRRHARKLVHPAGDTPAVMQRAAAEIDRLTAEVKRLSGQRAVVVELLADAANAIHDLPDEVETQAEADMLRELRDKIADARAAVIAEAMNNTPRG